MLTVKNAPNKSFKNLKDMMDYLVDNQVITEFGEIGESNVSPLLAQKIKLSKG